MEEKTILLKALIPKDAIRIHPSKRQFLNELIKNYGFNPIYAQKLLIECNREGLIEIDSESTMVRITDKGRSVISDDSQYNFTKTVYSAHNATNNKVVNWDRRNFFVGIIAILVAILIFILSKK